MRQSQLFAKTSRHAPEGEETANAKLLVRAGFIAKASAGVYSLLPFGLRVLSNINRIIREQMWAIDAQEVLMPALIEKKYWEKSDRWGTEIIYRTGRSKAGDGDSPADGQAHDFEYGLGWTHEEVIASIASNCIQSYKDLPKAVFQIQNKFRAETRAQGGLLRGREFSMKDLYSFHRDADDLNRYYEVAKEAYRKIYRNIGLKTIVAEASGGAFTSEYTHEFQVVNPAGEDTVYHCDTCAFAMNKEVFDATRHTGCSGTLRESRAIEVGNIFKLGTRFSQAFGLQFTDEAGAKHPVVMGSYGIGPTRIMGTLVEEFHDERGIIWPASVAPFRVHLLGLNLDNENVAKAAESVYNRLHFAGVAVLYDDRKEASAGEKFADADLLGMPYRAVVSAKTGEEIELKPRGKKETRNVSIKELCAL